MTAKQIEAKYGVNVLKHGLTKKRQKWYAFRGGNGTGEPVQEIAESYHLVTLAVRVARAVAGKPLVEVL